MPHPIMKMLLPFPINAASLFVLLSALLGCAHAAERTGPVVVGQTFIAGSEDPRSGSVPWALVSHGVAEKLFTVNQDDEIVPQIAESVTQIDEEGKIWDVTLKPSVKFSDGTELDAQHVADCLQELNEMNGAAQASLGTFTTTATSDLVVRIQSERPTPIMDSVLAEWVFVIYFTNTEGDFVYSGPYMIDHFQENDHIDLLPNPFYPLAEERPNIEIKKFDDGDSLADAMKDLQLDVAMHLPIDRLTALRATEGVNVRSFEVGYHFMAFYNTARSPTSEVEVRRAIDLVLDRDVLSQALAGGRGTRSFFPDFSPYFTDDADTQHGDKDQAAALLQEAGWSLGEGGTRSKDGQELKIKLVAYPQRPGLAIMLPEVEAMLQSIGITVEAVLTDGSSWDELDAIIEEKDFEMLMWAQHTLPAGDPAFFLNAFFRSDGSSNHAQFSSVVVDNLLDSLAGTSGHTNRVNLAADIHDKITTQVPMSNLVTPAWHVGLSDRVEEDYTPWGSDYYIIRADEFLNVNKDETSGGAKEMLSAVVLLVCSALFAVTL